MSILLHCLLVRPAPDPLGQGPKGVPEPLLELLQARVHQLLPLRGESKGRIKEADRAHGVKQGEGPEAGRWRGEGERH